MQDKVRWPAIGLIVFGILGVIMSLASLGMALVSGPEFYEQFDLPPEVKDVLEMQGQSIMVSVISNGINIALFGFMVYAGLQMKKLQSWVVALIGSIIAMIPCGACCCLPLPIGIWAIIVLMNKEVKAAFDGGEMSPTGDPDPDGWAT